MVTNPQGRRKKPASRHTLNLCQVREILQNLDRPFATHYLPAKLASGKMTQWILLRLKHKNTTTPSRRRATRPIPSALSRFPTARTDVRNVPACHSKEWKRLGVTHPYPLLSFPTHRHRKCVMMAIMKIATLNNIVVTNRTRVGMLTENIRSHDFDIFSFRR